MVRLELERWAERLLVPACQLVRLGRHELVEEALHLGGRDRAGELGGHTAVAERLHRGDAADTEALGEALVLVHVQLRELDLAGAIVRGLLERGAERLARAAPVGPEVHHHGQLAGALDNARHEVLLADVEDRAHGLTETFFITMTRVGVPLGSAGLPSRPIRCTTSRPFVTLPSSAYCGGSCASCPVTTKNWLPAAPAGSGCGLAIATGPSAESGVLGGGAAGP